MDIEDAHVSFTVLRSCAISCKINYLLRVIPPSLIAAATKIFDVMVSKAVVKIVGHYLDVGIARTPAASLFSKSMFWRRSLLRRTHCTAVAAAAFISSSMLTNATNA